jgi:hypothetical protein
MKAITEYEKFHLNRIIDALTKDRTPCVYKGKPTFSVSSTSEKLYTIASSLFEMGLISFKVKEGAQKVISIRFRQEK